MRSKSRVLPVILITALASAAVTLFCVFNSDTSPVIFSDPYVSVQQFMEGFYYADKTLEAPEDYRIRALIVPHHLTATTAIASGFRMLGHQEFSKILLLAPDHFSRCKKSACTVNGVFKTAFGEVSPSPEVVSDLLSSDLISNDPELFKYEHGIYGVLPYISHYFPGVTVTPVVISQKTQRSGLLKLIGDQIDEKTVLTVSSDFSHYLDLEKADEMDEKTAKTIFAKDLNGLIKLENPSQSDCPDCLWILGSVADKEDFYNPSVVTHTNSARILDDEKINETTSHFSMVWYENSSLDSDDITVAGDVTLTRATDVSELSPEINSWWSGNGLRLVNLEGPLAENCESKTNPYIFCNPEDLWSGIKNIATHWGTMNNHMLDLGTRGFSETKKIIGSAGETTVTDTPYENETIRLYAFTAIMNPVREARSYDISKKYNTILADLRTHNDGKLNIVFVHYGTEYQSITSSSEDRLLESFIDAGADAVIGCHSHVVSDMRIYKGKPIFHSIGNFVFDQYDSPAASTSELVRLKKQNNHILFETLIAPAGSDL